MLVIPWKDWAASCLAKDKHTLVHLYICTYKDKPKAPSKVLQTARRVWLEMRNGDSTRSATNAKHNKSTP